MTTPALMGRDVFMRHTDGDGKSYVERYRCWDADLFEAVQRKDASKQALDHGNKTGTPGKHRAERITESVYVAERAR